jgi:hypothetical protein
LQQNQQAQQQQQQLPPIANAGISKTVTQNTIVTLDGTASYSPNAGAGGKIVAYQWTQLHMGVVGVFAPDNACWSIFYGET